MRLIDADALKDEFCAHCATLKRYKRTVEECRNYIDPDGNGCFKMRYIDSSPTVDAVPVADALIVCIGTVEVGTEDAKHRQMVLFVIM